MTERRQRANGRASRAAILDAAAQIERLTTLTLAGSDGIFIAARAEAIDIPDHFETLAHAILGAARAMGWTGSVHAPDIA